MGVVDTHIVVVAWHLKVHAILSRTSCILHSVQPRVNCVRWTFH